VLPPWTHHIDRARFNTIVRGKRAVIENQTDIFLTCGRSCDEPRFTAVDYTISEEGVAAAEDEIHPALNESMVEEQCVLFAFGKASRSIKTVRLALLLWKRSDEQRVLASQQADLGEMGAVDIEVEGYALSCLTALSRPVLYDDMLHFQELSTEKGCVGAEGPALGHRIDLLFRPVGMGDDHLFPTYQVQAAFIAEKLFVIHALFNDDRGLLLIRNGVQGFLDAAVMTFA